jgi:hypothetical protein
MDDQAVTFDPPREAVPDSGWASVDIEVRRAVRQEVPLVGVALVAVLPNATAYECGPRGFPAGGFSLGASLAVSLDIVFLGFGDGRRFEDQHLEGLQLDVN